MRAHTVQSCRKVKTFILLYCHSCWKTVVIVTFGRFLQYQRSLVKLCVDDPDSYLLFSFASVFHLLQRLLDVNTVNYCIQWMYTVDRWQNICHCSGTLLVLTKMNYYYCCTVLPLSEQFLWFYWRKLSFIWILSVSLPRDCTKRNFNSFKDVLFALVQWTCLIRQYRFYLRLIYS